MATRPDKYPRWASVPSVDPIVGGANVLEPTEQKKDGGWVREEKPPGNYQNWLDNLAYRWIEYFDKLIHFKGVEYNQDSGDAAHDINFKPGSAFVIDGSELLILESEITKKIDATWAEGDDAGGFPDGLTLTANTPYHEFLIGKPDGSVDVGYDASISASNLLADAAVITAGYTKAGRVGTFFTENATTNIRDFIMKIIGNTRFVWWKELTIDYYKAHPISSTGIIVNNKLKVPPDISVMCMFNSSNRDLTTDGLIYFSSPFQANQIPVEGPISPEGTAAPLFSFRSYSSEDPARNGGMSRILTNTTRGFQYRVEGGSNVNSYLNVATIGWEE